MYYKCTKFQNLRWAQKQDYIKTMQNLATGGGDHKNEHVVCYRHFQSSLRYQPRKLEYPHTGILLLTLFAIAPSSQRIGKASASVHSICLAYHSSRYRRFKSHLGHFLKKCLQFFHFISTNYCNISTISSSKRYQCFDNIHYDVIKYALDLNRGGTVVLDLQSFCTLLSASQDQIFILNKLNPHGITH